MPRFLRVCVTRLALSGKALPFGSGFELEFQQSLSVITHKVHLRPARTGRKPRGRERAGEKDRSPPGFVLRRAQEGIPSA